MSAQTAQQLASAAASGSSSELSPSLQLLCEYCSRAESDAEMRGRFKTMATVNNIEAVSACLLAVLQLCAHSGKTY
jgi:hypothetical protein